MNLWQDCVLQESVFSTSPAFVSISRMIFYYGLTEVAEVLRCAIDSCVLQLCVQPTNCPCDVKDMNRSWRKPQMACCFHTSHKCSVRKWMEFKL